MFADTLDAITTDRPYRKALDPEEARKEFIKFRGKQFDPTICDVVVGEEVWPCLFNEAKNRLPEATEVRNSDSKAVA
jgi:HD-GYP domain-containing protein (c-di-GMP phosphodiesterase class II)